jgi:hypothetical protein
MNAGKALGAFLGAALLAGFCLVPPAQAVAPSPAWSLQALAEPTNFSPGEARGPNTYEVFVTDSGAETTDHSQITIIDTLPEGLAVKSVALESPRSKGADLGPAACETSVTGALSTVTCKITDALAPAEEPAKLFPGDQLRLAIHLEVPPSISGALTNRVAVEGGGAKPASGEIHNEASQEEASAGFEKFHAALTGPDGLTTTAVDSHPYQYTVSFAVNTEVPPPDFGVPLRPAQADLKTIEVALPPGLAAGSDLTRSRCTAQQFISVHHFDASPAHPQGLVNECPAGSAVGVAVVEQLEGVGVVDKVPLYNLVPSKGMPAQFGFEPVLGLPVYIDTKLRSDGDYGVTAYLPDITQAKRVTAAQVTVWGTPADPSHDTQRGECAQVGGSCPAGGTGLPFLRLPSSCADPLMTTMSFETWAQPSTGASASFTEPSPVGCELPDFSPTIDAQPTTSAADSPSGLHFDLHLPQAAHEDPAGLGEADLREARVTLPPGLLVNPSSADGLAGCSESQIGYEGVKEGRQSFSAGPPECPDASRLGSVQVDTPLVDHPLPGSVYLATQDENPFDSLIAIYITVDDPQTGVVVKLAGEVEPDPVTGQLSTTVKESPQLPFEDFKLDFFEGARAPLASPPSCGTFTTTTDLSSWGSPLAPDVTPSSGFSIDSGAGGGPCPSGPLPFAPGFSAGMTSPQAGGYGSFTTTISRADGEQRLGGVSVTTPPGLLGVLKGVALCPEPQAAEGQCAAASQIGETTVAAGVGPNPFWVHGGRVYLTGPYNGGPFGLSIVVPAIAGPFNLGNIVVRSSIRVDPHTSQISVVSDPLPQMINSIEGLHSGIPSDVRTVNVTINRPGFTFNPTNCAALSVTGTITSPAGTSASVSSPFHAADCASLPFHPTLEASVGGKASKANGASLTVKVTSSPGQANIAKTDLTLPLTLPSRLSTIQKACLAAVFEANPASCDEGSLIGTATVHTPVLNGPLTGPGYLVSHGGAAFPDVEFVLQGEGITLVLDGATDIKKGITYSKFETVPDAPVETFEAVLSTGPHSALTANVPPKANYSLCGASLVMPTLITGQNGAVIAQSTKIKLTGCPKVKVLTRAQKLAKAIEECKKKPKSKRAACTRLARKRYGRVAKKKGTKKK